MGRPTLPTCNLEMKGKQLSVLSYGKIPIWEDSYRKNANLPTGSACGFTYNNYKNTDVHSFLEWLNNFNIAFPILLLSLPSQCYYYLLRSWQGYSGKNCADGYMCRKLRPKNVNASGEPVFLYLFCQASYIHYCKDKNKISTFLNTAFKLNLKTSHTSVQGLNFPLKRKSTEQVSLSWVAIFTYNFKCIIRSLTVSQATGVFHCTFVLVCTSNHSSLAEFVKFEYTSTGFP